MTLRRCGGVVTLRRYGIASVATTLHRDTAALRVALTTLLCTNGRRLRYSAAMAPGAAEIFVFF
jgi:hypothetical protein